MMVVLILFEPYFFHFALEIDIYVIIYVYVKVAEDLKHLCFFL